MTDFKVELQIKLLKVNQFRFSLWIEAKHGLFLVLQKIELATGHHGLIENLNVCHFPPKQIVKCQKKRNFNAKA